MRVLGVIPARGGSVRVPRKNLQVVGHATLLDRAMEVALCANRILTADVRVSTDDPGIAVSATRYVGVVARACGPDGPMAEVLRDALDQVEGPWRERCRAGAFVSYHWHEAVACIQPTSPFRRREDIDGAIALLEAHPEANSVVSVNEATGERNGAVYVTRVGMLRDGLVFDAHSLKYPMPAERSIDINTPEDLEEARRIAKEKGW